MRVGWSLSLSLSLSLLLLSTLLQLSRSEDKEKSSSKAGAHLRSRSPPSAPHTHAHAHTHRRPAKARLSSNQSSSHEYGVDLPAFAFDFSEFFVAASLVQDKENSVSPSLSLSLSLLGHATIYEDFPFEALATDFEHVSAWQRAVRQWPARRRETERRRENLFCVIQNNIINYSKNSNHSASNKSKNKGEKDANRPYIVPAQWMTIESNNNNDHNNNSSSSNFNRHIDVLRCKLRNVHWPHSSHTHTERGGESREQQQQQRLFVDVVRKENASQALLLSFSLPWHPLLRQTGYPSSLHTLSHSVLHQRSPFNHVHTVSSPLSSSSTLRTQTTTHNQTSDPSHTPHTPQDTDRPSPTLAACIPGVRFLESPRPQVTLPMFVEQLEHLRALGVQHVVAGLALHPDSFYWHKYREILREYIDSGLLSIVSTADTLPMMSPSSSDNSNNNDIESNINSEKTVWDDVSGFQGVQLQDRFADLFFVNACVARLRGIAELVLVLRANQFLFHNSTHSSPSPSLALSVLAALNTEAYPSYSAADNHPALLSQKRQRQVVEEGFVASFSASHHARHKSIVMRPAHSQTQNVLSCSVRIDTVFGVTDPEDAFSLFGPGDATWTQDFYGSSVGKRVSRTLRVFSTKHLAAVDINERGDFLPVCLSSGDGRNTVSAERSLSPSEWFANEYRESFSANELFEDSNDMTYPREAVKENFERVRASVVRSHGAADRSFFAKIKSIAAQAKQSYAEALERERVKVVMKSRSDIKAPFWQLCNTEHLAHVLERIFPNKE